MYGEDEIEWDL